jgi:hypothetical protein
MSARRNACWRWIAHVGALAALLLLLCDSQPAQACGGFFCSTTPIDQTAERIIFTVNGDETITAYVQIQYSGERDAFAWVVPVPSVPVLDTFPRLAFNALDLLTQPSFRSFCGERLLAQGGSQFASGPGVIVYKQQAVGPFQTVTLGGDSAQELVSWLQDNGYRISDSMLPFINFYVRDHMLFLAMKLLPDADVSDIEPVAMTYRGTEPMIPLRLTAVAAKPELGVLAFILADRRYGPRNYAEITISDDLIRFDEFGGRNNYLTLVSREIDHRGGGHAFVTEYAHGTADLVTQLKNGFVPPDMKDAVAANDALVALLGRFAYLTRLYTRISPEEMTVDPVFVPASSQVDVSNVHDTAADHPCVAAPACTFSYCGPKGMCLPIDARTDGCYCESGATAMVTPTFGSQPAVYCAPVSTDVLGAVDDDGGASPCRSIDCGQGVCTLINGNPTCQCTAGHVAMVSAATAASGAVSGNLRCVSQMQPGVDAGALSFDAGLALDAGTAGALHDGSARRSDADAVRVAPRGGAGCNCSVGRPNSTRQAALLLLLGLLSALALRARARGRRAQRA